MTKTSIRRRLRKSFGAGKYRIIRVTTTDQTAGDIHVYGKMPNAIKVGWYLYGHIDDPHTLEELSSIVE